MAISIALQIFSEFNLLVLADVDLDGWLVSLTDPYCPIRSLLDELDHRFSNSFDPKILPKILIISPLPQNTRIHRVFHHKLTVVDRIPKTFCCPSRC